MKSIFKISILLSLAAFSSCGIRGAATSMTANMINDGMGAFESESDLWIAKQTSFPLVKILEVLGRGDPDNQKFQALMAMVYGNVSFGFLEPEYLKSKGEENKIWLGRVDRYYKAGFESGMTALTRRFGKKAAGSVKDFETAIKKAGKKDLKLLFWTAFDLGHYINLHKDDVTVLINVPKVDAMIERILEVDPDYAYGAARAFKAAMLASRPPMLGGNPTKAKELFEEAVKVNDGKYLMSKVMYAEWYALPLQDFSLARTLLKEVVGADPNALPEQVLANKLARERAEIILAQIRP